MGWFVVCILLLFAWVRLIDWFERREDQRWEDHKRLERLETQLTRRLNAVEDQSRLAEAERELFRRSGT